MRLPERRLDGHQFEQHFLAEVVPYLIAKGATVKSHLDTIVDFRDGVDFDVTFEGRLYRVDVCLDAFYKLKQKAAKGGAKKENCIIDRGYLRSWIELVYGDDNDVGTLLENGHKAWSLLYNSNFRHGLASRF
jgi:hypothetical protein